ncbi:hypothetical protein GF325_00135 [Candidatus Bathyarchaeota archaeon]|nr:hypothetical protein [Candidatus Bathyarchaeota archaeon]
MKGADKFIIITGTVCIVLAIILFTEIFPEFNTLIDNFSNAIQEFGINNGLWAAFILSTFGNTSVLIIFPYAYIVFYLGSAQAIAAFDPWAPLILGIVSGLGAGIGEVSSYVVGRLFTKSDKLISSDLGQKFERMRKRFEEHPKSIPFMIYLFALTPLPDDAILVPFGIMKYSYKRTIIPCMFGKMTLCTALAYLGYSLVTLGTAVPFLDSLASILTSQGNAGWDMVNLLIMFLIVYLMLRLDFEKMMTRKKGKKDQGEDDQREDDSDEDDSILKCQFCGWETYDQQSNFCGNCGKSMEDPLDMKVNHVPMGAIPRE